MLLSDDAFFLKGPDCLSTNLHSNFLAIHNDSLHLEVRLPDFLCTVQRKGHIVSVLFTFACEFTYLHNFVP